MANIILENYNEQDLLILIQALSSIVIAVAATQDIEVKPAHFETIAVLHDDLWAAYRRGQD